MTRSEPVFALTPKQDEANKLLGSAVTHVFLRGGARSGKTFLILRAIAVRAMLAPESRHAFFRFRFNHLRHSVLFDTLPKMMRLCFPQMPYRLQQSDWFVEFPNGSRIVFAGLDQADRTERVLGTEFSTVALNEVSQITYGARNKALTRLAQAVTITQGERKGQTLPLKEYLDANPTNIGHWSYKLFLLHQEPTSGAALPNPEDYATLQLNPADNARNISPDYIAQLESLPERDRRRFLLGEFAPQVDHALWTLESFRRVAKHQIPDLRRVVVGVDPSGASGPEDERSDEIGIVVAGVDRQGTGYVLEDLSGHYSPQGWARAVVTALDRWQAERIVAERNFGGAMVESTIRAERGTAPVKLVTASRGKSQRAEPVAALYERGKVRHLGVLPDLEDQLMNFSSAGYMGDRSPDRGDACIWSLSELMLEPKGVALVA